MAEAIDDGIDEPRTQIVVCCGWPRHAGRQVVADVHEQVDVRLAPVAVLDAPQDLLEPAGCPSRHGVHCPHDSRQKNRVIRHAARTTQVVSSITTIEPDPSMDPASPTSSWPRGRSRCSGPNHGADTPPGMMALSGAVAGDAAAESGVEHEVAEGGLHHLHLVHSRDCARARPGANRRVPVERPAPRAVKASDPLSITHGRLDSVSTLLTTVGSP